MCMYVCTHVHTLAHTCGGQRSTLGVIPQKPSTLNFMTGSPIGQDLTKQARLTCHYASGIDFSKHSQRYHA